MSKKQSARIGFFLGVSLSIVILYFLLRDFDFPAFLDVLGQINYWYLPLLFLLLLLSLWIRTLRWPYLLPKRKEDYSMPYLFKAVIIGFFASFVLPLRAGEFARPWILSRWQPVSFGAAFASVVTERLFDIFGLLLTVLVCLPELSEAPLLVTRGIQTLSGVAALVCIAMLFSYFYADNVHRFASFILEKLFFGRGELLREKILGLISEFTLGLRAISSFKQLVCSIFWTVILWFCIGAMYLVVVWMFGENPSYLVGFVLSMMISFAVAAPSAPGFIGTFQFGCYLALSTIYGYSKEFSVAVSLVAHFPQLVFFVIAGIWILQREGIGIKCLQGGDDSQNNPSGPKGQI